MSSNPDVPDQNATPGTPAPVEPAAESGGADETARLRRELDETRRKLHDQERRATVERALAAAGAIDPAATVMLVDRSLPAGVASEPQVRDAVARLASVRPALFRGASPPPVRSATPMSGVESSPPRTLRDLAGRAGQGDRGSLLEYLRARRAK